MNNKDDGLIFVIAVIFMLIGMVLGAYLRNNIWEGRLIKRDLAEYNSITGDWQWKNAPILHKGD